MRTNLTDLERKILDDITQDNFYEDGLDSCIWSDVFLDETSSIESKKARGVLSSLIKKGILDGMLKGRNATISFTEYGKELMKELGYEE